MRGAERESSWLLAASRVFTNAFQLLLTICRQGYFYRRWTRTLHRDRARHRRVGQCRHARVRQPAYMDVLAGFGQRRAHLDSIGRRAPAKRTARIHSARLYCRRARPTCGYLPYVSGNANFSAVLDANMVNQISVEPYSLGVATRWVMIIPVPRPANPLTM